MEALPDDKPASGSPGAPWADALPWLVPAAALLCGIAIGALGVALVAAGTIYDYRDSADAESLAKEKLDVIVLLAGARGRIEAGAELWMEYRRQHLEAGGVDAELPLFYVSGMGPRADWGVFAAQVKSEVLAAMPRDKVVLETESSDTLENATVFRNRAKRARWERMLLVTSSYHMKRAHYTFEKVLRKSRVEFRTLSVYQSPFSAEGWRASPYGVNVTLIEYIKWIYYLGTL
ncbi:MAG: YdcF family protein [Bdellovibrionales bacterium]|nr:YdcF family protein [Bdellovibrionales bacterium]